jgi:hypothetical protein
MECSECLPTLLSPLDERASLSQARAEEVRRRNASKLFAVGESRLFLEAQARSPSHRFTIPKGY